MLLFLLVFSFIPQAYAQANTPAPVTGDFSDMKHTSSGRVDKIIDAQTILMKDGKIIRLLGIDYPQVTGGDISPAAIAGKTGLERLLPETTEVMLYQSRNAKSGRTNRMGHILAHLVLKKDNIWVNGLLVKSGIAFTVTDYSNPDMATQLYALEQSARDAKLGLWADKSPYGLLTPATASQGDGQFRVVEGTVNRAATAKNTLFLNFGTDWKKDFTVSVSPALRKSLSRKGIDPMSLSGKKVRVRGWLREWNGPYMELDTVERLEILHTEPEPPMAPVKPSAVAPAKPPAQNP